MFKIVLFPALLCWLFLFVMPNSFTQAKSILPGSDNTLIGMNHGMPIMLAKAKKAYYEHTIKGIIRADCGRCHSGPTRNLMDYDNLKTYADSGMLATMVQGPMMRFAGNDARTILKWIQDGAQEKPSVTARARFTRTPGSNSPVYVGHGSRAGAPHANVPYGQMTYNNTVKHILAKDCIRCHNGPFRNLTTYKNVKMYVDNGLLKTLVLPGGPMHRFAGPDTRQIMAWINNGAPQ